MIYYEISDLYNENGVTSLNLKQKLDSFSYIKFYAFVNHTRTENVKPHFHVLIQVDLSNKKAKNRIEKDLKSLNPFVKNVRNVKSFARYLMHIDYVDKEKYERIEIITNNNNQYDDLIKVDLKKSKVEDLLNCFYNYLISNGVVLSTSQCFKWFAEHGQANYYICHQKSINDFMNNLFSTNDYLNEIERRLGNVDIDNNSCNYTIDNLI